MSQTVLFRNDVPHDSLRVITPAGSPSAGPSRSPSAASISDVQLIAVLDAPLAPGETVQAGYARKENELGTLFARLTILESRALHARLANPRPGDELATKFARLVVERRARLLAFLSDARRRAAIAGAR